MSDESGAQPLISADELERLADIFDRYFYADDPESEDCKLAEIAFDNRVEELHLSALACLPQDEQVTLEHFHSYLSCQCRRVIKHRNKRPKGI